MIAFVSRISLFLVAVSLSAGQLVRFPLPGQGGGLLISDVTTVFVLLVAGIQLLWNPRTGNLPAKSAGPPYWRRIWNLSIFQILYSIFPFIAWSLFTLVLRWPELDLSNFIIAFLYWLRLTATLLLLPALLVLFQNISLRRFGARLLLLTTAALILLGFLQLALFPNLNVLGWDPHQGRLVSTWLDPNFFGGFLIVTIPWLVTRKQKAEKRKQHFFHFSFFIFLSAVAALIFTQSRSSFLALAGSLLLLTPFAIWHLRRFPRLSRLGLAASGALSIVVFVSLLLVLFPERVSGLFRIDETASLRLSSFAAAWQMAQENAWLGVGYNAYQFAAAPEAAFDFTIHSRAGADSSLLTLWVTTGLPGVALFLLPWAAILSTFLYRALHGSAAALGAAGSIIALLIHSQFVNSFLYSHLLITLIMIIALCLTTKEFLSSSPPSYPRT